MNNKIKFRHAGIVVANRLKSLRFYRNLLGLRIKKEACESGNFIDRILKLGKVRVNTIKMIASDDSIVELLVFRSHKNRKGKQIYSVGPSHIALTVEDLDELYARLKKAGVKFNCPPQISPDGLAKVAFCFDPDGTPIELVQEIKKTNL